MRTFLASLCLLGAAGLAQAQSISGGDFSRYLRPGYNFPSDGEPFSHRYGYDTGMSYFYLNGNGRNLWYLEYLDRVDRAEKFGYRVPYDPHFEGHPVVIEHAAPAAPAETVVEPAPVSHRRVGVGWGLFRRR
jgi:hypothetical protein